MSDRRNRVTRKEVLDAVVPKMARFQKNLENAIQLKETGRHQVSVMIVDGVIKKIQVFTEDTVTLDGSNGSETTEVPQA